LRNVGDRYVCPEAKGQKNKVETLKRLKNTVLLILIALIAFSCFSIEDEYDFDGNDFLWSVSVYFSPYANQPLVRDSVLLRVKTDSLVGTSTLRINYDVDYDENEILIELLDIVYPQIIRGDCTQTVTDVGVRLNDEYSSYKLVFFSGDDINTGKLNYNGLTNKFYLRPENEKNVTFEKTNIMAES